MSMRTKTKYTFFHVSFISVKLKLRKIMNSLARNIQLSQGSLSYACFSLHWPLGKLSPFVCVSVPSQNTHFRVLWRLLVEKHNPNFGL